MPKKHNIQCEISSTHKIKLDRLCKGRPRVTGFVFETLIDFAYDAQFKPLSVDLKGKAKTKKEIQ